MTKFYGKVGYGDSIQTAPGVWEEVISERAYYGDVIRNARNLVSDDKVLSDIQANNSISIVADAYANNNFFAMRYVEWAGTRWIVDNVEVQSPRLLLNLGGVYNGPPPGLAGTP